MTWNPNQRPCSIVGDSHAAEARSHDATCCDDAASASASHTAPASRPRDGRLAGGGHQCW